MGNDIKIGFVGLGIMGEPMCRNIMKSGYAMTVYDIDPQKVKLLMEEGAQSAGSPAEVAEKSDITITMLPNNSHVEEVILGENGVLKGITPGKIVIDMSTISPEVSKKIAMKVAAKGGSMLDAPVVKSQAAAITGDLGILVGGPKETFEKALPVFKCMGKNVIHMGDNGAGHVMKLCHNMLVGGIATAVSEMLILTAKAGLSIDDVVKAVSYGGGQNFYLDSKWQTIKDRDFEQRFPLQYMRKDLGLALELGKSLDVKLPEAEIVEQLYQKAVDAGLGREDFSAVIKVLEE